MSIGPDRMENPAAPEACPPGASAPPPRGRSLRLLGSAPAGPGAGIRKVGELLYFVEGVVYSCDAPRLERMLTAALQAADARRCAAIVREFTLHEDGEYVVAAENTATGRCLLFNDALGRLPLFQAWDRDRRRIVLARSIGALLAAGAGTTTPDPLGIAARLLFGYPLDSRTEHLGIEAFPESGLVWAAAAGAPPECLGGEIDYGGDADPNRPLGGTEIEAIGESLVAACQRRISRLADLTPTLALSGGFDSRLVACALSRLGGGADAITRSDHLSETGDAEVAAQLAKLLGLRHHAISSGELADPLVLALVAAGEGALGCELAHMLGFLRQACTALGAGRFLLTGDGGDKTVAPLLPLGRLTHEGVIERLVAPLAPATCAACRALTGLGPDEIREYVQLAFPRQPGRTAAQKWRALTFRQRGRRWLNVGEDRNRTVFWSTSPFYAPDFFALTNAIPDGMKQRDRFYLQLQAWFDPRIARVPRPGRGRHPLAERLVAEARLQAGRRLALMRLGRRWRPRRPVPPLQTAMDAPLGLARECGGGVWELCAPEVIRRLLAEPPTAHFRAELLSLALWAGGKGPGAATPATAGDGGRSP